MAKTIAIAAGLAGLLFSLPAQPQGVQLNMTDSDLEQYCFFNGRLFSVGAFFCIGKGKMLQCQVFNKEKDKDLNVGERGYGRARRLAPLLRVPLALYNGQLRSQAPESGECRRSEHCARLALTQGGASGEGLSTYGGR